MNDLGWTLGWLAVRVAAVLGPALVLQHGASRRGPASGAWVATLSLGMVVVLGPLAFLPELDRATSRPPASNPGVDRTVGAKAVAASSAGSADRARPAAGHGLRIEELRRAWGRFERRAAGPVARVRPWGAALAWVSLAGSGVGLLRLGLGLWAVRLCRRRGKLVDDRAMLGLVEELRRSMACRPTIELREVPDLATPATAGWTRPMLLLPDDWRGWDESERRAVVAHELAHVVRSDYAAGLLARVAVVLNYYHPLVRWMAGRLHLEQELAADAMGARFSGGRSSYLLALSRLALKQEARPSSWPARAFLPSRGTLIRRIAMLKNESDLEKLGEVGPGARRLATALGLLALTLGATSWRAPARGADDPPVPARPAIAKAESTGVPAFVRPFEVQYLTDEMIGVAGVRPSAVLRRLDLGRIVPFVQMAMGPGRFARLLRANLAIDPSQPGWLKLGPEDLESIVCGINIDKFEDPRTHKTMGRLLFGSFTARTVAPFDWRQYLGQLHFEFEERREGHHVFYRLNGPLQPYLGSEPCVYFPDNLTVVWDEEPAIRKHLSRPRPSLPDYLRTPAWDRVGPDLFAIAFDNHGRKLEQRLDLGRPDDEELTMVLSALRGVERWVLSVPDQDAIVIRGEAATLDAKVAQTLGVSLPALSKLGAEAIHAMAAPKVAPDWDPEVRSLRMYESLLANLKVTPNGTTIELQTAGSGGFAGLGGIIKAGLLETLAREKDEAARVEEAKADPEAERR